MRTSALVLVSVTLLSGGCASIDWDAPKSHSTARSAAPSPEAASALAAHPGESGFLLLSDGIDALGARLLMAKRATVSIDAQYYFVLDDVTGHLFFRELLRAADRGVRVRLLLDDIATQGYDPGLAALDSHPSFEVRIFNPFTRSKGRLFSGASEFGRVNRRMHNKSFTVDGVATLVGGRNIGAEYFAARADRNFGDLDVFGFGPVASEAGEAFDEYWKSQAAVPISRLAAAPDDPKAALIRVRNALDESIAQLDDTHYRGALDTTILRQVEIDPESLVWAPSRVVYDAPEKSRSGTEPDDAVADDLREPLREVIAAASEELIIVSPYFVPLDSGVAGLCEVAARGVRTMVLTNSLASTDVSAVHAGYAPYREDLLECGVELYEVRGGRRAAGTKRGGVGMSRSSLHAKLFVTDRRQLFVGSFNWDPRSAGINTEMGVLMDSPVLATAIANLLESKVPEGAYHVVLRDGGIHWVIFRDGQEVVLDREPDTSWWQRFTARAFRLLPIRGQL
jgi:putative cardiolipin synthase